MLEDYRYTPDIDGYRQAVWDFMLEHTEILPSGKLFIKFHLNDRKNFEDRILSRWKHNYHREDVVEKAHKIEEQKQIHKEEKRKRHQQYKEAKNLRMGKQVKVPEPISEKKSFIKNIICKLTKQ